MPTMRRETRRQAAEKAQHPLDPCVEGSHVKSRRYIREAPPNRLGFSADRSLYKIDHIYPLEDAIMLGTIFWPECLAVREETAVLQCQSY